MGRGPRRTSVCVPGSLSQHGYGEHSSEHRLQRATCFAAVASFLLFAALHAASDAGSSNALLAASRGGSEMEDSVRRIHGDARLLLAHTIMAQGVRNDLAKVAGGKGSR